MNRLADKGVNLIKMLCVPDMTPQEAAAIVDQAHARGLKVAAHGRTDDESGEDYLFTADRFVAVEVPAAVRASLLETA